MQEFHAIIVDKSLADQSVLDNVRIIGKQSGNWTLYKIAVDDDKLTAMIEKIQSAMNPGAWYFHFYNHDGSKLIVVFRDASFAITSDKSTWAEAIKHGQELGTILEQLDFVPNTFAGEQY